MNLVMTQEQVLRWLTEFRQMVKDNEAYLGDLDSAIGDGDHGINMCRGTEAMMTSLESQQVQSISEIFKLSGMALLSKVGGASGPLYGSAFIAMSKKANEEGTNIIDWLEAGLDAIKLRGKSDVEEKTMVDVWQPSIKALKSGTLTVNKIDEFVDHTKELKALKGRASYLGDRSIGHIDPGAVSSGYLFKSLISILEGA